MTSKRDANGLEKAREWLIKSRDYSNEYSEVTQTILSHFLKEKPWANWNDDIRIRLLAQLSNAGIGYASMDLAAELQSKEFNKSPKNLVKAKQYLKKAVEQNYAPAFMEYAHWLLYEEIADDDFSSFNNPENERIIYETYMKLVHLDCGSARYFLATFIDLFPINKTAEIPNLLLPLLSDPNIPPSLRESAIAMLCRYGVGDANQKPASGRWCMQGQ